jgi:hypothetical protein
MNFDLTKKQVAEINRDPKKMADYLAFLKVEHEKSKARLLEERDLTGFLYHHNQSDVLDGFLQIEKRYRLTPQEYWTLLRHTWTMSEVMMSRYMVWALLLNARRKTRHLMMTPKERARLDALPDPVTVYRGCGGPKYVGFSWTLSKKMAERFAVIACNPRRGMLAPDLVGTTPTVIKGTVAKRNIVALINDRKEQEIIAYPNRVKLLNFPPCRTRRV